MFLGVRGSIAGGQMYDGGRPGAAGTYSFMWKIAASKRPSAGSRKLSTLWFGVERSMWQRQIQRACDEGKCSIMKAGWGSWTITKS